MKSFTLLRIAVLVAFTATAVTARQDAAAAPGSTEEITPAQQAAVRAGLDWLARNQDADGAFGGMGGPSAKHAGITALAGIAFMQDGNLPNRGRYGVQVRKAMEFVLASCQESGLIASDNSHGPMYGHGFATLFLAEIYGMTRDDRVRDKLQRAIRLIERSQNAEGGWRYQPVPFDADISVTICQVMALRAARDAGIKVEKAVIDKAIAYVKSCQNEDGGFSYMKTAGGGGGSLFPRSAAGIATYYYAGISASDEINRGLAYLNKFVPGQNVSDEPHYFYGHYYCVQAMYLAGGQHWSTYYPAIRDQLIARQNRAAGAGNWSGDVSDDYATAMALIILQMPNRYLPVYSGKGPGS